MPAIHRILIANRAEIARRVMRTCRDMGIATVAVFTEEDACALHAREAAVSVRVPSYLDIAAVVEGARRTGADAIHPGYGFLSENPEFAEACESAGIVFIGPPADVMRLAGSKIHAREVAAAAAIPVVPAVDATQPTFPLLVKASAGGGGRGMRVVRWAEELPGALDSARREACNAFGDGTLLLESYIEGARHIEVQVIGDAHGHIIHLGERECSLQRRHQKVIEEAPSPALNEAQRRKICNTALSAAQAMGYQNAGTVEFLLAPSGEFYFIEVNARIQVEHPVTEAVTGLDLVRLQIEVAEGRTLRLEPSFSGHAIEARLCAEDPARDFLPSSGTIHGWSSPDTRVDHAVEAGMEIAVQYDSLLAKVIARGPDRATAVRKLAAALRALQIAGPVTNRDFLIRTVEHPAFLAGEMDTGFFVRHRDALIAPPDVDTIFRAAAATAYHLRGKWRWPEIRADYRNNPFRDPSRTLEIVGQRVDVTWQRKRIWVNGREAAVELFGGHPSPTGDGSDKIDTALDGIRRRHHIVEAGDTVYVDSLPVRVAPRFPENVAAEQPEIAQASMPGRVLKILVEPGQTVKAGDPLLLLEAMKIEHTFRGRLDGVVEAVYVKEGEMVAPGRNLVKITRCQQS
jgi:propionyl-CoA carboxylase alpha chain